MRSSKVTFTTTKRGRIPMARAAGIGLLALALATPVLGAGSRKVVAREDGAASSGRLVGVWLSIVTLRDCASGAQLGLPFHVVNTFHADGTVNESVGTLAFAPNQRTEEHGVWRRVGPGVFEARTIALLRFTTDPAPPLPGFLAGWQVIDYQVTLEGRNSASVDATVQFYDSQGRLYRSGCSTAVSERFE